MWAVVKIIKQKTVMIHVAIAITVLVKREI